MLKKKLRKNIEKKIWKKKREMGPILGPLNM